ncbi:hypothetical protein ACQCVE_04780 [Metabacillus sp. 113a]|uniref:hypothetical protein n=1 Tax=Metabacillus sp. 113a TaxID=3404706 RepID=UPI003CEB5D49
MSYKKWLLSTMVLCMTPLILIGGFNLFMDPLWMFSHSHKYNHIQESFNERQQKLNKIAYTDVEFDTLLLGSSRTTYINEDEFKGHKAFNFAASGMSVQEYSPYIEFINEKRGKKVKTIILGLDFFATAENRKIENPNTYIRNVKDITYPLKTLLSYETFSTYSLANFEASYYGRNQFKRNYSRENTAVPKENSESKKMKINDTVETYKRHVYGETYRYNKNYKNLLSELKRSNPDVRFIVFTTPVSAPLYKTMIESGRFADYEHWLRDVTSVFGEVYHFMYPNTITNSSDSFYDGHHFYPEVGELIAHKVSGQPDPSIPGDFGMVLTEENLRESIRTIKGKGR